MRITLSSTARCVLVVALLGAFGLGATRAEAQRLPAAQRGPAACFHKARGVPGLSGLPTWPTAEGITLASGEMAYVAEPRWGNAPLVPLTFPSAADRVRFRVLTQPGSPNKLAVSIQVVDDANGAGNDDYVTFGFATPDGNRAWAIQYTPFKADAASPTGNAQGNNLHAAGNRIRSFVFDRGLGAGLEWTNTSGASATFIDTTQLAHWNSNPTTDDENRNGAKWSVQFKVNLPGQITAENALFFAAAHLTHGPDGSSSLVADNAVGNIFSGCGTVPCRTFPEQTVTDPALVQAGLPWDPADWTSLSSILNGTCTGVSIDSSKIVATTFASEPHTLAVNPSQVNTFEIRPTFPTALSNGAVAADLFIANWGSVVGEATNSNWVRMTAVPTTSTNNGSIIPFSCTNAAGSLNVCNKVPEANIAGRSDLHQCMQAQLKQGGSATPVDFDVAGAFTNMIYEHLSETSQLAEISVKGLQALLKNTNARTVYLHVAQRNMPVAGSTSMSMDVNALNALRAQADPTFADPNVVTCSAANARCFPGGTNGAGRCLVPPQFFEDGLFCSSEGQLIDLGPSGIWCPPTQSQSCTLPAGGGIDPGQSAMTPSQKLRAELPNYEVYPYYDTGKRLVVNGVTQKVLVAMPSFGLFVTHGGPFYGYLTSLVEETGSFSSPASKLLTQITPDLFKLTIPNEGTARLRVKIASADRAPDPFFEIVGTATPLGLTLGNATFTGVARTRNIDLSAATVTIQTLLESGGKELVTNKVGAIALTRQAGALPGLATFSRTSSYPNVSMQVARLPLVGQTIAMQVTRANISVPASCPFSLGTATIKTQFTISDPAGAVIVYGSDQWLCLPGQLLNF